MPIELVSSTQEPALPIYPVALGDLAASGAPEAALAWAQANDFTGEAGRTLTVPGADGALAGAFFGLGGEAGRSPLAVGGLARALPPGAWRFANVPERPDLAALALLMGGYTFTRYAGKPGRDIRFHVGEEGHAAEATRLAEGVYLARDLINTPANDMGPDALERVVRDLADRHEATVSVIKGDALLAENLPMIHAVGRAGAEAPRLVDLQWGPESAPRVTLVGKGVCFDTGGLDIKPPSGMILMKKDMGGAANVLGLAAMIMAARMRLRLRVLIPAVENAIAGNAFRPGDILKSRKGTTVEIGNTDAEGRLVLADALALADEEEPELLVDMATLTGAARVALGPELPPFYTDDDTLADALATAADSQADPLWRMPLWAPYDAKLASKVADVNNVTTDGFAGSITAALFLKRFVEKAGQWAHFDIFGWNPIERPHCPVGGEAQGIRAIEHVLRTRFGR